MGARLLIAAGMATPAALAASPVPGHPAFTRCDSFCPKRAWCRPPAACLCLERAGGPGSSTPSGRSFARGRGAPRRQEHPPGGSVSTQERLPRAGASRGRGRGKRQRRAPPARDAPCPTGRAERGGGAEPCRAVPYGRSQRAPPPLRPPTPPPPHFAAGRRGAGRGGG